MSAKSLGSSGVLYTDRRDFYIRPNVVKELWTDIAPFTTVVANEGSINPPDPQFKMFEHRNPWQKQQVSVNDAAPSAIPNSDAGVAVTVDGIVGLASSVDSSYIGLEFEVWNSALTTRKGACICTAVSGSNLTMKSLKAASITLADNDVLIVIGNSKGEGTTAREAWADELQVVWNESQIFTTPVEITGTLLQAALRGETSELARLRDQKSSEHKFQKEQAFLNGVSLALTNLDQSGESFADSARTDANGKKIRTTYGIISALEDYGNTSGDDQNVFTITEASYKYSDFVDQMEKVFQYVPESGMKRAFCGAGALSYWSKMDGTTGVAGKSGFTVNMSDMKRDHLGFNYKILETPHGILQLIPTPALRGPRNKYMLVVSEENLFHAIYRAPKFQANIKTDDGYDGVKDQYFSDEGIGITLLESHKLFKIA